MAKEIFEYRGIEGLVYAEVIKDDSSAYTTGTVKDLAGAAKLTKAVENGSETHYYDNSPAIVINSTGADTVTIDVSGIPFDVLADITGQDFKSGMFIEGPRVNKYYAIGYRTKKTNGNEVYVWRYKGQFSIPDTQHTTENNGTDAAGQSITFTGIQTTFKFTKTGKGAKAINVDEALGAIDVSTFFDAVTTPDNVVMKDYALTITPASGDTITVKRDGSTITASDPIHYGDELTITHTGTGTLKVNGIAFTSGNVYVVEKDTTIISE